MVVVLAALRRYRIAVFVFLLTVGVFVARYESPAPPVAPAGVPGAWNLTFADDFDGAGLDATKWSTGWFGDGVTGPVRTTEPACYDPAQVRFPGDGTLHIALDAEAQTCSGAVRPWSTGLITTNGRFSYTYGAAEARMYLPADGAGRPINWPAFWANGQNWPHDGENDIVESESGSTGPHFHSAAGDFGFAVPGDWTGWHTFGSVWEPGRVTYYYDGREVGSLAEGITSSPMYLVLGFGPAHEGVTRPGSLRVDYVRVWQRAS